MNKKELKEFTLRDYLLSIDGNCSQKSGTDAGFRKAVELATAWYEASNMNRYAGGSDGLIEFLKGKL